MQSIKDIRIRAPKSDQVCPKHGIKMSIDRHNKLFCEACVAEKIKQEKNEQVKQFNIDRFKKVLRANSLVDKPSDFDKTFANYHADNGTKEAQVGNETFKIAMEYINNPDKPITTVLYGTPGEGKTHLSMAMLNKINEESNPHQRCLFVNAEDLFSEIFRSFKDDTVKWNQDYALSMMGQPIKNKIGGCDVLVLDDFGSESSMTTANNESSDFKQKILKKLFDRQPRIIVNTNLTIKQMKEIYNPKIISRLFENSRGRRIDFSGISDKRY